MALLRTSFLTIKHFEEIPPLFIVSSKRCISHKRFLSNRKNCYDVVVVGGGIVGVAVARELSIRNKALKMAVVEKENDLAKHQSGHNSGVVHAGIYYKPGTLKAKLCVEGLNLSYKYFDEKNIPYKKCGKLIVATSPVEIVRLKDLYERGLQNNVKDIKLVEKHEIKKIEPYCEGLLAIHSPHTGIVDWAQVTKSYGQDFINNNGEIIYNFEVTSFKNGSDTDYPVVISSKSEKIHTKYVLTCGGLQSDILSSMSGGKLEPQVVPVRGEYLLLNSDKCHLVKGNIYPVPDPRFPFLGVHFTPRMDGSVWLGPNAVPCFKREGYQWSDVNLKELIGMLSYIGFLKLSLKYLTFGASEIMKSVFIEKQIKELQKFIPNIIEKDVKKGPAGVRAQALDKCGNLVDDFVFDVGTLGNSKRILHCRNAPSPGATSSLAIAKYVADKFEQQFDVGQQT